LQQIRPYYATKWDLSLVSPEHPEWCVTSWEVAMKSRLARHAYALATLACLAAALGAGMRWH
jgi:hypothetical protein